VRLVFGVIAALVLVVGCGTSRTTTLSAANFTGNSVLVVHDGAVVATLAPGFRGKLADVDGWGFPRTVRLTTPSGTELGAPWNATEGEYNLDMAECGQVFLWIGGPDPSFDPAPSFSATECPGT
jgi:hypothetical protein